MENKEIEKTPEQKLARYEKIVNGEYKDKNNQDHELKEVQEEKKTGKSEIREEESSKEKENTEDIVKSEQENQVEKKDNSQDLECLLNETKRWGQEKNKALLLSKRKVTEMANKLKEDGVIEDEAADSLLSAFNISDEEKEETEEESNPYTEVGKKLQAEFKNFKRYNKSMKDADARYAAFFNFFPMLTDKEKEETMNYLQDAEENEAIEYVMTHGGEFYNNLYKGVKEKGSVIKYLKDVHKRLEKAEKKAEELASELDSTTEKVYNKNTDSRTINHSKKPKTIKEYYQRLNEEKDKMVW